MSAVGSVKAVERLLSKVSMTLLLCAACAVSCAAQGRRVRQSGGPSEFGPIVRAYLDYLRDQQEVVDDRVSRREVDRRYYQHNSNRIRALRQMAIQIARENDNDYLPELEAVTGDEFDQLFFEPPKPQDLRTGEVLAYQFRFLGTVAAGRETFYLFARLDPYEQADLKKQAGAGKGAPKQTPPAADAATRPRRAGSP